MTFNFNYNYSEGPDFKPVMLELYKIVAQKYPQITQVVDQEALFNDEVGEIDIQAWQELQSLVCNKFYQAFNPEQAQVETSKTPQGQLAQQAQQATQLAQTAQSTQTTPAKTATREFTAFKEFKQSLPVLKEECKYDYLTLVDNLIDTVKCGTADHLQYLLMIWRQAFPFLRPQVNLYPRILANNPTSTLARSLIYCLYLLDRVEDLIYYRYDPTEYDIKLISNLVGKIDKALPFYDHLEVKEFSYLLENCLQHYSLDFAGELNPQEKTNLNRLLQYYARKKHELIGEFLTLAKLEKEQWEKVNQLKINIAHQEAIKSQGLKDLPQVKEVKGLPIILNQVQIEQILQFEKDLADPENVVIRYKGTTLNRRTAHLILAKLNQDLSDYFLEAKPLGKIEEFTEFIESRFYTRGVLTPRTSSELIVLDGCNYVKEYLYEKAIAPLLAKKEPFTIVDLGSGSGCLGISILQELVRHLYVTPLKFKLICCDLSPEALATTYANLERIFNLPIEVDSPALESQEKVKLGDYIADNNPFFKPDHFMKFFAKQSKARKNVSLAVRQSDWLEKVTEEVDIIVANPPYIDVNDPLLVYSQDDPWTSLVAPDSGLQAYREIFTQAPRVLRNHGVILIEHGYEQQEAIEELITNLNLPQGHYECLADFEDIDIVRGSAWRWIKAQ
ncbi:hypothetical protein CKF54_00670 [Psittacicella hinzii]|uniref:Peptide chain release factor N(5)-glutamine methyltransferase n=1 Tax=Psittacicella hinzii TaxID=2028575 RepID=A0A3A1Y9Q1_9GAMM|nr:hypothetical protein [Psittacicella hinzii]RIY34405.1 hypothetical protein CKF54_00670 [Psittacicella hinzii]